MYCSSSRELSQLSLSHVLLKTWCPRKIERNTKFHFVKILRNNQHHVRAENTFVSIINSSASDESNSSAMHVSMEATHNFRGQMKDRLSIKSSFTARELCMKSRKENYWKWRVYLDACGKEETVVCYFDRVARLKFSKFQTKERIPFNTFPKLLSWERFKLLLSLLSTHML